MDDAQLSQAADALQAKMTDSFGSVVRFEFEGGGALTVDGNAEPPAVAKGAEGDADCTITASEDTFREMMDGDLDPTSAYMSGKLKIDGDMGAAMKVASALS